MKPAGVYVRQGASSVQASADQIRKMIKDEEGDVFEEMRALNQELSFAEAERTFARYQVDFSEEKYIAPGLRNIHDDQYTHLAMILFDQCQHTTKIAVFGDEDNIAFQDARCDIMVEMQPRFIWDGVPPGLLAHFLGVTDRKGSIKITQNRNMIGLVSTVSPRLVVLITSPRVSASPSSVRICFPTSPMLEPYPVRPAANVP